MKRVSYQVAKAIKEAGYPQEELENPDSHWFYDEDNKCDILRMTYLEVWLWLWREKKIRIEPDDNKYKIYDATEWTDTLGYHLIEMSGNVFIDPEEAIKQAIEYLVDKNLIK